MELAASAIDRMTEPDENELSRDANTPRLRPIMALVSFCTICS